jgi:hypothetical protein
MTKSVFIQRTGSGRILYIVEKDTLEITTHRFGKSANAVVPLKSILPFYSIRSRKVTGLLVVSAVLIIIAVTTAGVVARMPILSGLGFSVCYVFSLIAAACGFAVRAFQPLEYFVFSDIRGQPLFSIVRAHQNDADSNDFVAGLVDRLEQIHSGIEVEPPPVAAKSPLALPSAEDNGPKAYFILAYIAAVVGITYPPIEAAADITAPFGFLVACAGTTCAIVASMASFSHRERNKFWSLPAVALSCLPFVIY